MQVERRKTIEESFQAFHAANPKVYERIVGMTFELFHRGFTRCGIEMIFSQLRWMYYLQTKGDNYKLNNNYRALYARKVMQDYPELDGFFRIRERRSA